MSSISRSVYQKVKEENKRLIKDIRILCKDGIPSVDQIMLIKKYRKEKAFHDKLVFMIQNGLGPEDMINDISPMHEI